MKYNLPQSITSEKDLRYYEEYLKCDLKKPDLNTYLEEQKGKFVKAEICFERFFQSRIGVMLDVGTDYIVLKQGNGSESVIPISAIRLLTVMRRSSPHKQNFD